MKSEGGFSSAELRKIFNLLIALRQWESDSFATQNMTNLNCSFSEQSGEKPP